MGGRSLDRWKVFFVVIVLAAIVISTLMLLSSGLRETLDVTSAAAEALPAPAKPRILTDISVESVCSTFERFLYIGILTALQNRARRDAARQHILQPLKQAGWDKCVEAKFIIGHGVPYKEGNSSLYDLSTRHARFRDLPDPETLAVERALVEESREFGDIKRIPYLEWYSTLSDKVLITLQQIAGKRYNWFLKIDDDRGPDFNLSRTISFLAGEDSSSFLYAGVDLMGRSPVETQSGLDGRHEPYFLGRCYVISDALLQQIVEAEETSTYMTYGSSAEDMNMGFWVKQAQNRTSTNVSMPFLDWLCDAWKN